MIIHKEKLFGKVYWFKGEVELDDREFNIEKLAEAAEEACSPLEGSKRVQQALQMTFIYLATAKGLIVEEVIKR